MKLLILRPNMASDAASRPGVLWIHGGGYITGMPGMVYISRAKNLVKKYGAVVVSPDYRLAIQAPYPAALLDCHNALVYLKEHARELGVRSDQIMVGGESAGGGLCAAGHQAHRHDQRQQHCKKFLHGSTILSVLSLPRELLCFGSVSLLLMLHTLPPLIHKVKGKLE